MGVALPVLAIIASLLLLLLLLPPGSSPFPLCTNSWAPVTLKVPLAFCSINGSSCCNATEDAEIGKKFTSMNISNAECGSIVKSLLCAVCNPFSANLFNNESNLQIPILCNSSTSSTDSFCAQVWDSCEDTSIPGSPFAPNLQGTSGGQPASSNLSDLWQSKDDFCKEFGGSPSGDSVCFDGNSVIFNTTNPQIPQGICLERIGNESYLDMTPLRDGSNRVFLSSQAGLVWLASVPEEGSGGVLLLNQSSPFLDLTDVVEFNGEFGLLSLALHPNFTSNGRFFVSYNCDKVQSLSCSGRCSCNSDVDCDPEIAGTDNGASPCRYQSVVAEYTVNGSSTPSSATKAYPTEVRRIFTMGLPYTSHHGGQIIFGPQDGYLYFMMGDGGSSGDPFNFAQNKKSLLGKILRIDVDNIPSVNEINNLDLWGNYSIPKDNPFADDSSFYANEVWALGFSNPWRCAFDSERLSYFYCSDAGQSLYEEVDLISKGGNYGWRVYEGPYLFHPTWTPGGNTTPSSINAIFPIMGYNHSSVNVNVGAASVIGGFVYRSMVDPCMYGKYLYADLYGEAVWAGIENPEDSGNYTSMFLRFDCANDSPISCEFVTGSSLPSLGYVDAFGQDNRKDVFFLTSRGVYRVARPSRCGYSCPLEKSISNTTTTPSPPSSTPETKIIDVFMIQILIAVFFLIRL